jgi:hypothetical protein
MRHAFDAALDDVERGEPETPAPPRFSRLSARLAAEPPPPGGHHSLWETAAAWTPEADPPPPPPAPPPPPPPPSDQIDDIAAELDFYALRTSQDLARARRKFMWANHPDRRPDIDRDLANRRVALANMLLDAALRALRLQGRG